MCSCRMYESAGWSVFSVEWRLYSQDRCVSAKHSAHHHHAHCPHRQAHSTQLPYRISEPTRIKLVLTTLALFEGQRHPSSLSMGFVEFALRIAAGLGVQPQRNMCHLHHLRHLFQLQSQPLRLFYLKGQFSVRSETVVAPPCVRAPVRGRCPLECCMSCRSVPLFYLPPLVMLTMTMMLVHTRAAPVQSVHMHVACLATLLSMIFVEESKGGR